MTVQPVAREARTYKVNSLDRGLDVLRVIRNADGPVRNHDIVTRTGLPKATVSRLVHTLTVMGYLRRIDQGSYVLGQASGRSGRAMLEGLKLERYAPLFGNVITIQGAYVAFGMLVGQKVVPVFRWSAAGNILITSGVDTNAVDDTALMTACCLHLRDAADSAAGPPDPALRQQLSQSGWCHQWHRESARLTAAAGVRLSSVAEGILSFHLPQSASPTASELAWLGQQVLAAAAAIANESPNQSSETT